jgi:hypothetical protein
MSRHTRAVALAAILAIEATAQTRVDLRTQTKSVDFSGATSTKPSQTGAVLPSSCAVGQTFLNTSAQPGQNLYICTAANVWTVQGANGLANYATTFTGATAVTVPGSAHQLNTGKLFVEVYDTESPAVLVEPDEVEINPATYDVTVKFATLQSGTVMISAAGGGGGGSGAVSSVFGRLGTVTAQAGDYTAAQVTNAAATNASNTFTAGTQDFSGAQHTLPTVDGPAAGRPSTCAVGEMYFATDAAAGQNWYYCTAANAWTAQVAGGGGSSAVASVFGRLGTVAAQAGDYTAAQVTNAAATNASNTFTAGTQNFSSAQHTLPAVTGLIANRPGTCMVGEMYFATDAAAGQNWYYCTAANTWTPQATTTPLAAVSLNGTTQGAYSALNFVTTVGLNWLLTPNGNTLNLTPRLDSAVVPSLITANTYPPGVKQTVSPNTTTAGLNVSSASLPSTPAEGDLAIDPNGNLNWYNGTGWRLATVADTALTTGAPVVGDGNNHVTSGSVTGTGSFVMSSAPTISNPVITSFVNSIHNHSNAANGGSIAVTAFSGPVTFSSLPVCSSTTEGSRGAVSDSTTNTWGSTVTGGGANHILAYCDGTNWTVAAK